jgi:hypothetical protein
MVKAFTFAIPNTCTDLNNDRPFLAGDLEVSAVANLFSDGDLRTIDINTVTWRGAGHLTGEEITKYINTCHPDIWENVLSAAATYYTDVYVTSKKSTANCCDS